MIPFDLHFLFPEAFALLLMLPLFFVLFYWLFLRRSGMSRAFSSEVLRSRSKALYWIASLCFLGSWALAAAALAQPVGNAHYPRFAKKSPEQTETAGKRKWHQVIFLLDVSASMGAGDTRTQESRLEYAKEIAESIVENLTGESAALIAFTSKAQQLSPPTMDYFFVQTMLRQTRINEGEIPGTDLSEALGYVREQFYSQSPSKLTTLILLSDGGDVHYDHAEGEARRRAENAILRYVEDAAALHLKVFTIGMGSVAGAEIPGFSVRSSLNESLLQQISRQGLGKYYASNEWTPLKLAEDLTLQMKREDPFLDSQAVQGYGREARAVLYDSFFQIPLAGAILLLALALLLPQTRRRI